MTDALRPKAGQTLGQLRLADPSNHARQLLTIAAGALAAGDLEAAIFFSDRLCRLPLRRQTGPLLIRAEALNRKGDRTAALADVEAALAIDPDDAEALNRRMLWGAPGDAIEAARRVVRRPAAMPAVAYALTALKDVAASAAAARCCDGFIAGWIAWRSGDEINVRIRLGHGSGVTEIVVRSDPSHTLASALGHAAKLVIPAPRASGLWSGLAETEGDIEITLSPGSHRANPKDLPVIKQDPNPVEAGGKAPARCAQLTVIVPVYLDVEATRQCLESLSGGAASARDYDVVLVNDASPDPEIKELIAAYPFHILTNAQNIGFAKSANRALAGCPAGDIVLLNADAVLPPRGLDRILDAAYSASDIGTVTPLSNNGELTSLPRSFETNPMPAPGQALAYDAAAQSSGLATVVDLPTGIGFCLFVRHDCLKAIERLSEDYDRGYGEDVDICLRAREAGFRSVCATNVFVAHAGTRSFGPDKRALVVRNLRRMEAHFPMHRAEVAGFRLADPLAPARFAILKDERRGRLSTLIVATPATRQQGEARCAGLATSEEALLAVVGPETTSLWICEHEAPTLQIGDAADVIEATRGLLIARIEICDPVLFLHEGFALPEAPVDLYVCGRSAATMRNAAEPAIWARALAASRRYIAPDAPAAAFCSAILGVKPDMVEVLAPTPMPAASTSASADGRFGVIALNGSGLNPQLLTTLGRLISGRSSRSGRKQPVCPIIVFGTTPWDETLMASGLVHIAGPPSADKLAFDLERYAIRSLWLATAAPVFGHPMQVAAANLDVPTAGTDWGAPVRKGSPGCVIKRGLSGKPLAELLAAWHDSDRRRLAADFEARRPS